jgi:hypothetical protein
MTRMARMGACAALIVAAGVARGADLAGEAPPSTGQDATATEPTSVPAPAPAPADAAADASTGAGAAGTEPQEARPDPSERVHQEWVQSIWNSP